jgi:hypothetical protein
METLHASQFVFERLAFIIIFAAAVRSTSVPAQQSGRECAFVLLANSTTGRRVVVGSSDQGGDDNNNGDDRRHNAHYSARTIDTGRPAVVFSARSCPRGRPAKGRLFAGRQIDNDRCE